MIITTKRLKSGIRRLTEAPKDIMLEDYRVRDNLPFSKSSSKHRTLFASYVKELNIIVPKALSWWKDLEDVAAEEGDKKNAWITRPAGPASDPHFVALIRKYWLACHQLNQDLPQNKRVFPEFFLLSWLNEVGYFDSIEIIACMPYWPIGLDESGNWC